eukprot:TRINITY_DN18009_c1_g3_i1.p1 TRINITY_DN18009_c1_g3~~TRINITY_DN18009_c1_g3_i1.p1  ORF type:complete len:245 (+),score=35.67 TRINITY_DN18009_c1_g3_i1:57-791(+)
MLMRVAFFAYLTIAAADDVVCNRDLVQEGLPVCTQACEEWCWATVVGVFRDWYGYQEDLRRSSSENGIPPATPKCKKDECDVVTTLRGNDCCASGSPANLTGCHAGSADPFNCYAGGREDQILKAFKQQVPHQDWHFRDGEWEMHPKGVLSEEELKKSLMAGNPVGRQVPGHIDAIVGCKTVNGVTQYRVMDSLMEDPQGGMWFNSYNELVLANPDPRACGGPCVWYKSFYSTGPLAQSSALVV